MAVFLVSVLLIQFGCESEPRVTDRDVLYLVGTEVDMEMTDDSKGGVVLLDPRSEVRYHYAHIPGAINIPLPDARADDPLLNDARLIIVYGHQWDDPVAKAMNKKLISFGYTNVVMYQGGLEDWAGRGREFEGAGQ